MRYTVTHRQGTVLEAGGGLSPRDLPPTMTASEPTHSTEESRIDRVPTTDATVRVLRDRTPLPRLADLAVEDVTVEFDRVGSFDDRVFVTFTAEDDTEVTVGLDPAAAEELGEAIDGVLDVN